MSITHWHAEHKATLSYVERLEEMIANFCGTRTFFFVHVAWFIFWIMKPVEAFPYGLLTMVVSLEAILLSTIIMMNQNRQNKITEAHAANDQRVESEKLDMILSMLHASKAPK